MSFYTHVTTLPTTLKQALLGPGPAYCAVVEMYPSSICNTGKHCVCRSGHSEQTTKFEYNEQKVGEYDSAYVKFGSVMLMALWFSPFGEEAWL